MWVFTPGGSGAGASATGTGFLHFTAGVADAAAKLVVNADVDAAAAVAGTKISPDFGAQNIVTTGYISIGGTPAASGNVRLPNNKFVVGRTTGGTDYNIIGVSSSDGVLIGELAANKSTINLGLDSYFYVTSGELSITTGSNRQIYFQTSGNTRLRISGGGNLQFGGGAEDAGGGVGVIGIDTAGTLPTTDPTAGSILYVDAGATKVRGSSSTVTTIAPA